MSSILVSSLKNVMVFAIWVGVTGRQVYIPIMYIPTTIMRNVLPITEDKQPPTKPARSVPKKSF